MYPPRSEAAIEAVHETVRKLAAVHPDFISVTYGASGSNKDASFELLAYLRESTDVPALAHLTSAGSTASELAHLVNALMDAGILDFLALRGDPPAGVDEANFDISTLIPSAELVRIIQKEQLLRLGASSAHKPRLAVAAYPNGHERSVDRAGDIRMLIEKQEAGANLAITQLFFYADDYLSFVEDARAAGLTIPVLPGLMPVSTVNQLLRVAELSGQSAPRDLLQRLEDAQSSAPEIGVEHTVALSRELLAGGAPGIHLYTFNKHESALSVLQLLGLI